MSTKSTMWYGSDFHLYREGFDDAHVYLDIRVPYFEQLTLKIPLEAWKEMRKHTIEPNETYLELSNEELRQEATRRVKEHRRSLDETRAKGGHNLGPRLMGGFLVYGDPEASEAEMVEHFVRFYRPSLAEQEQA